MFSHVIKVIIGKCNTPGLIPSCNCTYVLYAGEIGYSGPECLCIYVLGRSACVIIRQESLDAKMLASLSL